MDEVARIVAQAEVQTLVQGEGVMVIGADDGYPFGCQEEVFAETATNVISVPRHPYRPRRRPALANATLSFRRADAIAALLAEVSELAMAHWVGELSDFHTRHSMSEDAFAVALFLRTHYLENGFHTTEFHFDPAFSPCIVAELAGTERPDEIVVVGAHYDSRSTRLDDVGLRAPGADDNGSGSATMLELAARIHAAKMTFKRTLRIISFCGEEQGLVGSRAYAKAAAERGDNIVAMFNADMLGWQLPGVVMTLGMKDRYIDEALLDQANQISRNYVPELALGLSGSCCSDHQSFTENGFSAIGFFENTGSASSYPYYHKSTDTADKINMHQVQLQGRAVMASALYFAQPNE